MIEESKALVGFAGSFKLGAGLVNEAGKGGADGEVFDMAEGVDPEASGAVDYNQARGAAQTVAAHRNGCSDAWCVGVHTDGKRDAVLVQERFQGYGGHGLVVFEDGVEPQQRDVIAEVLLDSLCLRNAVGNATWAQHLECLDHDDFASETCETRTGVGVEPASDGEFRGGRVRGFRGQIRYTPFKLQGTGTRGEGLANP